jgi:RNA polymerase sigma factor (sigma-70 family)
LSVTAHHIIEPENDAVIIEASRGDPERFAAIFGRYFGEIHRYLARRVGTKAADDLAADVFLTAFSQRQRYNLARHSARPWLYGIATNLVGAHGRQEARYFRALARADAKPVWHAEEDRMADRLVAEAARPALLAGLAQLRPGDRDVLLLVALADLGYQEVAQALGIPYGTVCSRLNRARRQLRASLGDRDPADQHEDSPQPDSKE